MSGDQKSLSDTIEFGFTSQTLSFMSMDTGQVTQMMYDDQKNLSDAIRIVTLVSFPNTTFTLIEVLWFFFHLNFATVYFGVEQPI